MIHQQAKAPLPVSFGSYLGDGSGGNCSAADKTLCAGVRLSQTPLDLCDWISVTVVSSDGPLIFGHGRQMKRRESAIVDCVHFYTEINSCLSSFVSAGD